MPRNHPFFVRGDDQCSDRAVGSGYPRFAPRIGCGINLYAQPLSLSRHQRAYRSSVFANTAGKDQDIQAANGRSQGAEFAADPVAEQFHGFLSLWSFASEQRPHVLRNAGNTQ